MQARVLIGYSRCQATRQAFEKWGHSTYTCDLLPNGNDSHLQMDVWEALRTMDWDFAVLHPMCSYLTVSAAWAYKEPDYDKYPEHGYHQQVRPETLVGAARCRARDEALENFQALLDLPFPVAVENPARSFINKAIRPPDQIIHPWQFGDDASKATGLWLTRGTPTLALDPAAAVEPRMVKGLPRWANQTDSGQNRLTPSAERWLERSATYPGIAHAMGDQWGQWLRRK